MRIFSGVQPTGSLHLGNYLGAIKGFVENQTVGSMFCIVDLHAMTMKHDPKILYQNTLHVAAAFIAAGIDPKYAIVFPQSRVREHSELAWILQCVARVGWLDRMVQFREKTDDELLDTSMAAGRLSQSIEDGASVNTDDVMLLINRLTKTRSHREAASVGLYTYPVLQAADILLYRATHVPVGDDQMQHMHLVRDIAEKFNHDFKKTFPLPNVIKSQAGRIMSLKTGTTKMSKSDPDDNSRINLLDSDTVIARKIKRALAMTEAFPERLEEISVPAVKNLVAIYSAVSGLSEQEVVSRYTGKGFGVFKPDLADLVINEIAPIRDRMIGICQPDLSGILHSGADRAREIAELTMRAVRRNIGIND